MISPFIEKAEAEIGLFTFYKSQQKQPSAPNVLSNSHHRKHRIISNIEPKSMGKQLQLARAPLLCQKFLKDIRNRKQGLHHSIMPEENEENQSEQKPTRIIQDKSQISINKTAISNKSKNTDHNATKMTMFSNTSSRIGQTNKSLHESISTIRNKFFGGEPKLDQSISKVRSRLEISLRAQLLKSQLYSFDKRRRPVIDETLSDQPREECQDKKPWKKAIHKKMSFRERPIELSFQNQLYFKRMIDSIESDQSLCNKIFRQSWKMPEINHISHRLKTEHYSSQPSKLKYKQTLQICNLTKLAHLHSKDSNRASATKVSTLLRFHSQK